MSKMWRSIGIGILSTSLLAVGLVTANQSSISKVALVSTQTVSIVAAPPSTNRPPANDGRQGGNNSQYSIEQAASDQAQLSTIAFNALAFITGSSGADTFMPPGKVADFFGFQYMRDIDQNGYGHNTTFLTRAANNVLTVLDEKQTSQLIELAKEQAQAYTDFAYNRFPLMEAFRRNLEGDIPAGSGGLSRDAVEDYTARLYGFDAKLSYRRAEVVGAIINSLTTEQRTYLDNMAFNNSATWPYISEEPLDKESMSHTEHVAVMTYASELFSWYKGSVESDTYFCPERHGTYFGGFYMKDYPAMNNPDYFISTAITGDSGQAFLQILTPSLRQRITEIIDLQRDDLQETVEIRRQVATELRKTIAGQSIDRERVMSLIARYGELDGAMSHLYASRFAEVSKTLTSDQRAALVKLRNLDVYPEGAYLYSSPIKAPTLPNTDFFFGQGSAPSDAGQWSAPDTFTAEDRPNQPGPAKPDRTSPGAPQDKPDPRNRPPIISIRGQNVRFDVPPMIKSGRMLVPVRAVVTELGAVTTWDPQTQTVIITKGQTAIKLVIGQSTAMVNGQQIALDVPAEIINDRTLVPLRFVAEALHLQVEWDEKTQTSIISGGLDGD